MLQTVRTEKVKNGVICLVSMFLKLCLKECIFCNFILTSARNVSIKANYINASERYRYALSENDFVYYAITYCFRDIRV